MRASASRAIYPCTPRRKHRRPRKHPRNRPRRHPRPPSTQNYFRRAHCRPNQWCPHRSAGADAGDELRSRACDWLPPRYRVCARHDSRGRAALTWQSNAAAAGTALRGPRYACPRTAGRPAASRAAQDAAAELSIPLRCLPLATAPARRGARNPGSCGASRPLRAPAHPVMSEASSP